jgi:hypothetical protein
MNRSQIKTAVLRFIVRRAFRHGSLARADLKKAFDISVPSASRYFSEAPSDDKYGRYIQREGHRIKPKALLAPPSWAGEEDLLNTLDYGCYRREDPRIMAQITGLFHEELPLVYVSWTNSMPKQPGTLTCIVQAIMQKQFLRIVYVSLNPGEEKKQRVVAPLALEKMNDQWRLIAQDTGKEDYPIRVYVLSRILQAEALTDRKAQRFPWKLKPEADSKAQYEVRLNTLYSEDQKAVLCHELGIDGGVVSVATRSEFEFLRRFSDQPNKGIWPPLFFDKKRER